jgi:DNA-directed RNA polymerase specialized sigma subunit
MSKNGYKTNGNGSNGKSNGHANGNGKSYAANGSNGNGNKYSSEYLEKLKAEDPMTYFATLYHAARTQLSMVGKSTEEVSEILEPLAHKFLNLNETRQFVRRNARVSHMMLPEGVVDYNDVESIMYTGLWDALKNYVSGRAKFTTYAPRPMGGRFKDYLRKNDKLSRWGRDQYKSIKRLIKQVEQENLREPSELDLEEAWIANSGARTKPDIEKARDKFWSAYEVYNWDTISLDAEYEVNPKGDSFESNLSSFLGDSGPSPAEQVDGIDLMQEFYGEISRLRESGVKGFQAARIIIGHEFEAQLLRSLGKEFGVTESAASQLHIRVLKGKGDPYKRTFIKTRARLEELARA